MKRTALIAAIALALATTGVNAATQKEAADAVLAAVSAIEKAASVGGEWRDSYKILGEAKKAYRHGDYDMALEKANIATSQGEMGFQQAREQANASMPEYVR